MGVIAFPLRTITGGVGVCRFEKVFFGWRVFLTAFFRERFPRCWRTRLALVEVFFSVLIAHLLQYGEDTF
ncbi:MAG: hypothetical protein ACE5GO_09875 [Anaerolineales bacterium]